MQTLCDTAVLTHLIMQKNAVGVSIFLRKSAEMVHHYQTKCKVMRLVKGFLITALEKDLKEIHGTDMQLTMELYKT